MADEPSTNCNDLDLAPIVVEGLRKVSRLDPDEQKGGQTDIDATHTECIHLPKHATLSALWSKLEALGYVRPDWLQNGDEEWSEDMQKVCMHPFEEIEVVQRRPSQDEKCINIDDPIIAFTNRLFKKEINLNVNESDLSYYGTAMNSLKDDQGLNISFHRTIRMPDDDKLHQLPGSLGTFPIYNVNAYADRLPDNIVQQGGVFLPMWQREALWINFDTPYLRKYALRIFIGRINAVSGLSMDEKVDEPQEAEMLQDYVVVPGQEWLDGICVAPGIVRQFVAMSLGSGYTVEGQKTREEKFGGLQIEIIPSYETGLRTYLLETTVSESTTAPFDRSKILDEQKTPSELKLTPGAKIRSYPSSPTYCAPYEICDLTEATSTDATRLKAVYRKPRRLHRLKEWSGRMLKASRGSYVNLGGYIRDDDDLVHSDEPAGAPVPQKVCLGRILEGLQGDSSRPGTPEKIEDDSSVKLSTKDLKAMGLAAGGKLVQDIYRDSHPARTWNTEATRLVHVHILDPASCEKVTHIVPPPPPIDAMGYVGANMPFFVVEEQVDNRVEGGDFDNVASVSAMDKKIVGVATEEPEFDPSKPRMCKECETRLCDCIVRPCDHQFCNVCIKKLDNCHADITTTPTTTTLTTTTTTHTQQPVNNKQWKCPLCNSHVTHVAGFSAPMNLPGEEALKVKVPVHVLKIEDGRVQFRSIQTTRI